jgi:tetratricopeptide (TPR) repeat protein
VGWASFATANAQPLEQHYRAARIALKKGHIDKAERELKLSLQDNPLHAESHLLLASLLARGGDLDQAMVGFQQALTFAPNNAVAKYNLGTAMLVRGKPVSAARLLEGAIAIRPDHVPSYNNLAKAYCLVGLPGLAAASYQEALRREPSNAIALEGLTLLTATAGIPETSRSDDVRNLLVAAAEAAPPSPLEPPAPATENVQLAATTVALRELLCDMPHVTVEPRGDRVVLNGWTSSPTERTLLGKILEGRSEVLDLTTEDVGDTQRLLEVDAILFSLIGLDSATAGHNFLKRVEVNASLFDGAMASFDWLYSAAISYEVNIANVVEERVAFLARPHLTTLSGTPATFIAGGDIVYQVTGLNSGDIKPYPFGTTLEVTPTLLRTRSEDGIPRVRIVVKAGRKSVLALGGLDTELGEGSTAFANVEVTSEAVLNLNQTLILTGLNQRERRTGRSGVPVLKDIPIIKYLFSEKITRTSDTAIIILLTPRDPAFWDEQNRMDTEAFVKKRTAFIRALQGTEEDMRRFKERYPDWSQTVPNRFASHFFLMENSEAYRAVSGTDLASENLDLDILGKRAKAK